jgi:hypothetical protein
MGSEIEWEVGLNFAETIVCMTTRVPLPMPVINRWAR